MADVSQQVIERAVRRAVMAPETRVERVRQAREHLSSGPIDPNEIATKMLQRIAADALR